MTLEDLVREAVIRHPGADMARIRRYLDFARRLSPDPAEVDEALRRLEAAGEIARRGTGWATLDPSRVGPSGGDALPRRTG